MHLPLRVRVSDRLLGDISLHVEQILSFDFEESQFTMSQRFEDDMSLLQRVEFRVE